jgi:hypothetical protein
VLVVSSLRPRPRVPIDPRSQPPDLSRRWTSGSMRLSIAEGAKKKKKSEKQTCVHFHDFEC